MTHRATMVDVGCGHVCDDCSYAANGKLGEAAAPAAAPTECPICHAANACQHLIQGTSITAAPFSPPSASGDGIAVGVDAEDAADLHRFAEEALNGNRGCVTQRQAKSILYLLYGASPEKSREKK